MKKSSIPSIPSIPSQSDQSVKFTPGPWVIIPAREYNERIAIAAKGAEKYSSRGPIAMVGKRHKNAIKNAALIAAAPEMFTVLASICIEKSAHICQYRPESCKLCPIKKAIQKARGEQ